MQNTALIIIDIQNDYFAGGKFPLNNSSQAGKNAANLLNYFREKEMPVIHIQHVSNREGATFFLPETSGVEINELVRPQRDEPVVIKHFPNSFRETELNEILDRLKIEKLVLAGMMSNMCVDATTRAAKDLGYTCTVVHDACCGAELEFGGTKVDSDKVHAAFMAALGMFYAELVSTEDIIS